MHITLPVPDLYKMLTSPLFRQEHLAYVTTCNGERFAVLIEKGNDEEITDE